jgi:hypothetical protein
MNVDELKTKLHLIDIACKVTRRHALAGPNKYNRDVLWVHKCVAELWRWWNFWNLPRSKFPVMIALVDQESGWDPNAHDNGDGRFLGQTRLKYLPRIAAIYETRGVYLPTTEADILKNINAQAAYTVAEFVEHLEGQGNDYLKAVERYNGRGKAARNHRKKVARAIEEIFQ